jgi:predicted lipoprotein
MQDSPVDVGAVSTKRSALTIQDDHDQEMADIHSQALQNAVPKRDSLFVPSETEPLETSNIPPAATSKADPYAEVAKDAQERVAIMGPEMQQQFKDHVEAETSTPEYGTMQHDEVTKAVTAAVQCGAMKGLTYAE